MGASVSPIPKGFHTVTPAITIKGAAKAIEFYKKAFGAEEILAMRTPDGGVMHAEIRIGDSIIMLGDEFPEFGHKAPMEGHISSSLNIYVTDVDKAFERAVAAGAKVLFPLADQFWGDRYGKLVDPFGHVWGLATHKEDVPPDVMAERAKKMFSEGGSGS
jgi:PhnB protein